MVNKEELILEYRAAKDLLMYYSTCGDAKKEVAAKKILSDKVLLKEFVFRRIEKRMKKKENRLTGWKKFFKLSLGKLVA